MLEVAKIILVHLLQDHELLKTGARVVAQRKDRQWEYFHSYWEDGLKGRQEPWKYLQDCILMMAMVEKTKAISPNIEIFNHLITMYGDANWAHKKLQIMLWGTAPGSQLVLPGI